MVISRTIERLGLNKMIGNGWMQYMATVVMVLIGTIAFALLVKNIFGCAAKKCGVLL